MTLTADSVVEIKDLSKKYENKIVVDNISLIIKDSCFALLGPNGAGKTTTFLMLLGLVRPTSGTAFMLTHDIKRGIDKVRDRIGFLPENVGFYPKLTARHHLELILKIRNEPCSNNEVESLLNWCGINQEYWDKNVKTFSRGMKQRLGVAQAFAGNPRIVFLDEPLSNIDALGRDDLINKIRLKRQQGIAIVISSHIILELEQLAEELAFIDRGKIVKYGNYIHLTKEVGFNEYEITQINKKSTNSLGELKEIVESKDDTLMIDPKVLEKKIIFNSQYPEKINRIIENFNDFSLKPITGTLTRLYKHFLTQGEIS